MMCQQLASFCHDWRVLCKK